ncbi:SdrD B-like domain-containing protein [Colwellia sp. 1_MG-2023]|uniref:SdrD B-like domain-containing protein n=1 Tax=unclassified Colwellia TaxID=196834 RepID=UPI001C08F367|nr:MULTISPECIES: SdrD B-like domain-containing protein [unclassified Colwellia]MBU2923148.1 DUF11 domain-containing protein [Colwellia sp. C2M11]MDO6651423.1 SdrD B-like domain-containing protein [Colwellia sp. 3_MG-2023]MDO6664154.1 SdrD B-like domain-containing protein [Colwellia sp. 2_MG-2023]MDO6688732.1 SdrD B-like domain-containing protein [Colwellia sp. 1_MG-2023]
MKNSYYLVFFIALFSANIFAADVLVSTLEDTPDPAPRGGEINYAVKVSNNASDTANDVTLVFPLPATTTFVSVDNGSCVHDLATPGTVNCAFGTLAGLADIDVNIVIKTSASTGADIAVTATAGTSSSDINSGNNSSTQNTTIDNGADLSLTMSDSADPVIAGGEFYYTLIVNNAGPNDAEDIKVINTLPNGVSYVSYSGSGWSCGSASQLVTCTRNSLINGTNAPAIIINTKVEGAITGTITNSATVSTESLTTKDPIDNNNTTTENTVINPGTDLSITKTVASPIIGGETVTFTLSPRNNGPFDASNITVVDTLPSDFTFISAIGTGWSCSGTAGTANPVTCTRTSYAVGTTDNIIITTNVPPTGVNVVNSVVIDADNDDPIASNNTDSVTFDVVADGADLEIFKTKGPNPVAQGSNMTSTLRVKNNGPRTTTGIVTIVDILDVNESYVSSSGTNWTCAVTGSGPEVVTCEYSNQLSNGNFSTYLSIVTTANAAGTLTNNACATDEDNGTTLGQDDPVDHNHCTGAGVESTTLIADLGITKSVSTTSGTNDVLETTESQATYTLTVTNYGPNTLSGTDNDAVVVTDDIPGYLSNIISASPNETPIVVTDNSSKFDCTVINGTVRCELKNGSTMAMSDVSIFTITVDRPLADGLLTNTAEVDSAVLGDNNPNNNSASINLTVDPIADVEMTALTINPNPAKAGTDVTKVLTFRNNGPSQAEGVVVTHTFDPDAGFTYDLISAVSTQGSCDPLSGNVLTCTIGTLNRNETHTITLNVRPSWENTNSDWTLGNASEIKTTTVESDLTNNDKSNNLIIKSAELDLLINTTDVEDPISWTPTPAAFPATTDNVIRYKMEITNRGPSVATSVYFDAILAPEAGKQFTFLCDDASNSSCIGATAICDNVGSSVTGATTMTMHCELPATTQLEANDTYTRYLFFKADTQPKPTGDTVTITPTVGSNETDTNLGNNTEDESTSLRIQLDLTVDITPSKTSVTVYEPFNWTMIVANDGPGDSADSELTNNLPAGMELTGPPVPAQGSCTGAANDTSFVCDLETINNGGNVIIDVPVRFITYPPGGTSTNTATITTAGFDSDSTNNTDSDIVLVTKSSIAGQVYADFNDDGIVDGNEEGIAGVTLNLSGTDLYGNIVNLSETTDVDGNYLFDNLIPSNAAGYNISEVQPSSFDDGLDNASGSLVTNSRSTDNINGIDLIADTNLENYNFGELYKGSLSGFVFGDMDQNGLKDIGDNGIAGVTLTLTGTSSNGETLNLVQQTDADGKYLFTNLPPSNATGYIVTETHPTNYLDGQESINGVVQANSESSDSLTAIQITLTSQLENYNFGEWSTASISGYVFVDDNNNGQYSINKRALAGVELTLSGKNISDIAVTRTTTTDANGFYYFGLLDASDSNGYQITETQPADYNDGLDSISGVVITSSRGSDILTGLKLIANQELTNNNFGEVYKGQLSGFVFIDANQDSLKNNNETGIANVEMTLVGTSLYGETINLVQKTNANGYYLFTQLPPSNASGYRLIETHPADYLDNKESIAGIVVANSEASDTLDAIQINLNSKLDNYNFAEWAIAAITGTVFVDADADGIYLANSKDEVGIANVSLTLTGKDNVGAVVERHTTTDANGLYLFDLLQPSDENGYQISEVQPKDYIDGLDSIAGVIVANSLASDNLTGLVLKAKVTLSNNNFGELYQGSLSGVVFVDNNKNGLKDTTESGLANVELTLTGTSKNGQVINLVQQTDADGQYHFTQLPPSDAAGYSLIETHPTEYLDGQESIAGVIVPNSQGSDIITNIKITLTSKLEAYNFAEWPIASIAGVVFIDANADGLYTASETGIANVNLTLTGKDHLGSSVSRTVKTDDEGRYLFDSLDPSDVNGYQISEAQPTEYLDGAESIGQQIIADSYQTDSIIDIQLASNTQLENYNFAELEGASLSGEVWVDENDNGERDENELLTIADVTITLTGLESWQEDENVEYTQVTDSEGKYNFVGLRAGTYVLSQTQPAAWHDGKEHLGSLEGEVSNDQFSNIIIVAGNNGVDYNFGERGSLLSGRVFNDQNRDGNRSETEPGIPNVVIQLEGIDLDGHPVVRSVLTGVDGRYTFEHLPLPNSQGYLVTETQPSDVDDGLDSIGSHGGELHNDSFSEIIFTEHISHLTDYDFGELLRDPASISGLVWLDSNHNRDEDEGNGLEGWTVQLIDTRDNPKNNQDITPIAVVKTDSNGRYLFEGLSPGVYEVRFMHEQNGAIYGYGVSDEAGVDLSFGTIRNITLEVGEDIENQNLPIDPSGIVYDSKTREPVAGATVRFEGPAGFDPERDLVGGLDNVEQITGADGVYQFLIFNSAPKGVYTLVVTEPTGYLPGVSRVLLACTNTVDVLASPNPALVQRQDSPPALSASVQDPETCGATSADFSDGDEGTQYYLTFNIDPLLPSGNIINNHIPVDPIDNEMLGVIKTTNVKNASRGDFVPYSIVVTNNQNFSLSQLSVIDQLPPGFKYVEGSATIDGEKVEPLVTERQLIWSDLDFTPNQQYQIDLITIIGAGVGEGEYVNQAWGGYLQSQLVVTNIADATVRIVPDPLFDCSDIIGKVFDDLNANGYQDKDEAGIPAVRLATAKGLVVTTDEQGRYHIACAGVPNEMRGSNFILKIDERTLPSGFRITTENPRVVRLTRGKMVKANFGATIHRVVRIQLSAGAFEGDKLNDESQQQLQSAIKALHFKPSILRLAYAKHDESDDLIERRLTLLRESSEELWQECDCQYELIIEQEIYQDEGNINDVVNVRRAGNE